MKPGDVSEKPPYRRVLVITCGNPHRGDDGAGWHIGGMLTAEPPGEEAGIVTCRQLLPEMAEEVSRCRRVIFVDAGLAGRPGDISCARIHPDGTVPPPWGHDLRPAALLVLSRLVYGACPEAWLCSVTGECFDPGRALSENVRRALPGLLESVRACIAGNP
ncbi:MAG: hydrogenase maturation protease [Desulfobacterales bacterium]